MTAQKGRDLLLKLDSDGRGFVHDRGGPAQPYARLQRRRASTSRIRNRPAPGANCWRAPASSRRASAGSGIFKDAASDATMRALFFAGTMRDWQVIIPDFGTVEGPFQITALEFGGRHDGEVTFELALESAARAFLRSAVRQHGKSAPRRDRGGAWRQAPGAVPDAGRAGRTRSAPMAMRICWRLPSASRRGGSVPQTRSGFIGAGLRGAGNDVRDEDVAEMTAEGGAAGLLRIVARLLVATFGGERVNELLQRLPALRAQSGGGCRV